MEVAELSLLKYNWGQRGFLNLRNHIPFLLSYKVWLLHFLPVLMGA